ncbi:MAG: RHS repeat-associated core domain-containing protein [Candidatus Komeilibacteria bacterium]|nr:RHS repeat-associated core domain-containing protein [Candidatus Komeilibacteria bacterium]
MDTDANGQIVQLLDYFPYGDARIDEHDQNYYNNYQYTGKERDDETKLSYYEARYYDGSIGRFISQDPLHLALGNAAQFKQLAGQDIQKYLMDPQQLNAYSYASNNPLKNIDPTGQFSLNLSGLLPQNTQIAIGNWANNAYNNSSVARYALDHPYQAGVAMGLAGGAAAYTGAAGLTALSVQYLGGAGTACMAFCSQNGQKLVEQGIANLQKMDNVSSAVGKMVSRGQDVGINGINNFINEVQNGGIAYLDKNSGNINIFTERIADPGYLRITLNPQMTRVISVGLNEARNVINGIANGRFVEISSKLIK